MNTARIVTEWRKLPLSLAELCIDTTLRCGQSFRWRKVGDEWHCALHGRIISLKQDATHLHYRAIFPGNIVPLSPPPSTKTPSSSPPPLSRESTTKYEDDTLDLLKRYFNLSVPVAKLYAAWSANDANFARRAPSFAGVRILNQDAWEALVAFICSSNNNISRIGLMVSRLCSRYGAPLGHVPTPEGEGEGAEAVSFHDFPPPEALAVPGVEVALREMGFGYRARYIAETARIVATERPVGWLASLRNPASPALLQSVAKEEMALNPVPSFKTAHESLLELAGVGPKVADCVCLMGLGWAEAVPVDTHVWQIAKRDYGFGRKAGGGAKTFGRAVYDAVGEHFRGIWGDYAGWAQSVLFTANLRSFAEQAAGSAKEGNTFSAKGTVVQAPEGFVKIEETLETMVDGDAGRKTRKRKIVTGEVEVKTERYEKLKAEVKITKSKTVKKSRTR